MLSSIVASPMFVPFNLYALGNGHPTETFPQFRLQESDSMPLAGIISDTIPIIDATANRILSDSHFPVSQTLDLSSYGFQHEVAHFLVQDSPQENSPEYSSNTVPMSPEPSFSVPVMAEHSGLISAESSGPSELLNKRPKSSIYVSMSNK